MTDVGGILNALGGRGRFQLIQLVLLSFSLLPASYHLLNIIFLANDVEHRCSDVGDNVTETAEDALGTGRNVTYGECDVIITVGNVTQSRPCSGYIYSERADLSVVSDMNLVCDQKPLVGLAQTVLIGGQALGALTLPHVADRFGRKPVCLLSTLALLAIGVGISLVTDYWLFAVLRFICGAFQQGIITTVSTLSLELFPPQDRKLVGCCLNIWWALCVMTMPLWAYFLENYSWRILQIAYTSASIYFVIIIWKIEESIPWLVANGKGKHVIRVLKIAAKVSKVPVHDVMLHLHLSEDEQTGTESNMEKKANADGHQEEESFLQKSSFSSQDGEKVGDDDNPLAAIKPYTILDLFRNGRFLMNTCILWFMWFTNALTYFGLFLTSSDLAGNRFLNFFLNAVVELPSALIFYCVVDRIGRRKMCVVFHGITGVALIIATIIKTTSVGTTADIMSTVFSLIGKAGISGSFGMIFMYTPELYPINLRNVGLGMSSAFARIGGMLAPFSSILAGYAFWAPGTIFGASCLAVTVLVMLLPETTGRELPQTIEDMVAWYTTNDVIEVEVDGDKTTCIKQKRNNLKL